MTLQSPACWSQIEIPFGPQDNLAYEHALLWAERAQNEPLHISLWERLHTKGGFTYTDADVSRAVDFLAPLMSRVCAMSFQTDGCELDHLLSRLLACWAERGTVGTAKILEVDAGDVGVVDIRATSSFLAQVSLEKSQAFFCSLHTLSLTDVTLDRRLGFYSGLVDLYLGLTGASSSYSQWEIAAILAASPRLRSLAIFGVIDQTGTPGTVALNDLNTLQLESWMVLQMITSTSTSIRMRLSLENHEEFIPAARSFFERCKVTALHICSSAAYPPISSLFTYMPHLKLLAIESSSLFDEAWQGSTRPDGSSLDLWPQLDELYLANCDLNQNALPRLVSIHAPRAIWVIGDNWSVEARDQAEEVLQQHAVQFVWFKVWDPVSVEFWTLAASKFVSY
ncbi:hypothetical protein FRC08_016309 [Ceratobasidium sp. 394]|nr:hypothetical protein FRC08_016309 [Ceratobasidium sp. 394]